MRFAGSTASDADVPPGAVTNRRRLPKSARLRRSTEIRALLRSGTRAWCGTFDVFLRNSTDDRNPRLAIVVPKYGHAIVERNRLKRRVREILRTQWLPAERQRSQCRDLLVRAKPSAYKRSFEELVADLAECVELEPC